MAETDPTPSGEEIAASTSTSENNSGELTDTSTKSSGETECRSVDDDSLEESCKTMFKKISEYLQCELNASLDDYELLEKLNELTKQKYVEMDDVTRGLISRMEEINEKYKKLIPYLEMIDKVDASVTSLEAAAYKLDTYSKELEARFKKLEKVAS